MVNHSSEGMNAYYQLNDITGNVELLPIGRVDGQERSLLDAKEKIEVRIKYGPSRKLCEILSNPINDHLKLNQNLSFP